MITTFSNDTVYPLPGQTIVDVNSGTSQMHYEQAGLTKREYFAAMAMQGMLACNDDRKYSQIAAWAVGHADALIEELNKPIKP